jgi:ABC-type lipoprotein export system ATPase subunit
MLELKNIKKDYEMGEEKVHALKGINLEILNLYLFLVQVDAVKQPY